MYDSIIITVEDVKLALGLLDNDTDYDTFIAGQITRLKNLVLEEYFTANEFMALTPNQKLRVQEGLCRYIAGKSLLIMPVHATMSAGSSASLGPISMSGWSGGGKIADLKRVADQLVREAESILEELRLTSRSAAPLEWSAIGPGRTTIGSTKWRV